MDQPSVHCPTIAAIHDTMTWQAEFVHLAGSGCATALGASHQMANGKRRHGLCLITRRSMRASPAEAGGAGGSAVQKAAQVAPQLTSAPRLLVLTCRPRCRWWG